MKNSFLLLFALCFLNLNGQLSFNKLFHEYEFNSDVFATLVGDLNGDQKPDFVHFLPFGDAIHIAINQDLQEPTTELLTDDTDIRFAELNDFDQDGDLDIIGAATFENKSYWWKNDGSGKFTKESLNLVDFTAIHFADFNADGQDEMLLGFDDKFILYDITGGEPTLLRTIVDDRLVGEPSAITSFDNNGDGLMDIAAVFGAFRHDGVIIFEQSGSFNFVQQNIFPEVAIGEKITASDVNNDGKMDFFLFDEFDRETIILQSTQMSDYEVISFPSDNGSNRYSSFGDVDRDGDIDILYYEEESQVEGTISLFVNDNGIFTLQEVGHDESDAQLGGGGFADINQDGKTDVFYYANDFFDPGMVYLINENPLDLDGDGYGDDVDCDDENAEVNPGQTEIPYNDLDDDCSSATPDDDLDQDGYLLADDCDDDNANINPGIIEIIYNGIDDDCDSTTVDDDIDMDGFLVADDCDDQNLNINPSAIEIPNNGIDEDCDGSDLTSSIHNLANAVINIFPNPTSDKIYLTIDGTLNFSIKLFDVNGRLYFSDLKTNEVDLRNIQEGLYFLEVADLNSEQRIIEKIMVIK